jgi:hypothetical protein
MPYQVSDVRAAFAALRGRAERIGSWDMDRFPYPAYVFQNVGNGETRTHFQGIQRLASKPLLIVSGGDRRHSVSHLFFVQCGARSHWGPIGSNLWLNPRSPPGADRLRKIVALDRTRWHAGGISVLGDIVGVPLEGSGHGKIVFLDVSDGAAPKWASPTTEINCETPYAGAVAFTRAPNGQFLCAVWRDERNGEPAGRLDFFASDASVNSSVALTTFEHRWLRLGAWVYKPPAGMPAKPHYQGISFVWESSGKLFLIGTRNASILAPNLVGEDWADLFEVLPPSGMSLAGGSSSTAAPEPHYISSRRFRGADEFCSFAGCAGAFVSPTGALCLYGGFHFRGDGLFRMSEFWSHTCDAASWWIDLFERSDYEGDRLGIFDQGESRVDDYRSRFAQGASFDDTLLSARFCLPAGTRYRLFSKAGCPAAPKADEFVDLVGTGGMVEVPRLHNLNPAFGRCVRSSMVVV